MAFFPNHSPTTDSTTSNETTPTLTLSQQKELTQQIIQELKTNGEITPTFLSKLLPLTFTNTTTLIDRPSVEPFQRVPSNTPKVQRLTIHDLHRLIGFRKLPDWKNSSTIS